MTYYVITVFPMEDQTKWPGITRQFISLPFKTRENAQDELDMLNIYNTDGVIERYINFEDRSKHEKGS